MDRYLSGEGYGYPDGAAVVVKMNILCLHTEDVYFMLKEALQC